MSESNKNVSKSSKKKKTSEALANTLLAFDQEEEQAESGSVLPPPQVPPSPPSESAPVQAPSSNPLPDKKKQPPAPKKKKRAKKPAYKKKLGKITDNLSGTYQELQEKVRPHSAKTLFQRFKKWLVKDRPLENEALYPDMPETVQAFKCWLATLSPAELSAFNKEVADFCAGFNFKPEWLSEPDMAQDVGLKQTLEQTVIFYSLAYWKLSRIQPDLKATTTLRAWQKEHAGSEHKALLQAAFVKLVEKGLVSSPPSDTFLASEAERQRYMVEAVSQVAVQDKEGLLAVLKEI